MYSYPAVLISDTAYPVRVSFSLLNKILDEYTSDHWTKAVGDSKLAEYVRKYQDPKQAVSVPLCFRRFVWLVLPVERVFSDSLEPVRIRS